MPEKASALPAHLLASSEFATQSDAVSPDLCLASYLASPSKRAMDIVISLLLLMLLLPLLVLTAFAIVTSSRGGALFRQRRHGRDKAVFSVYKFRSMRSTADASFRQAVRGDPRVTPIGRIMRKTSIDELPQLINVLKGEMSLVGPRPHAVEHDECYGADILGYGIRFRARPGMTGLAQISGARGGTPTVADMRRRIAFDVRYIHEASLLLDLKILALTARELLFSFSDDNAY